MDAGASVGGGCCVACTEWLDMYCVTKMYGSGSSSRQAGCCGSCCKKSFDEDEFQDRQTASGTPAVNEQPAPQQPMTDKVEGGPPAAT